MPFSPGSRRRHSPEWMEVLLMDGSSKVKCKHCQIEISSKIERIKTHLRKCAKRLENPEYENRPIPLPNESNNKQRHSPEWTEVVRIEGSSKVKCKHCKIEVSSKIARIKRHLRKCEKRSEDLHYTTQLDRIRLLQQLLKYSQGVESASSLDSNLEDEEASNFQTEAVYIKEEKSGYANLSDDEDGRSSLAEKRNLSHFFSQLKERSSLADDSDEAAKSDQVMATLLSGEVFGEEATDEAAGPRAKVGDEVFVADHKRSLLERIRMESEECLARVKQERPGRGEMEEEDGIKSASSDEQKGSNLPIEPLCHLKEGGDLDSLEWKTSKIFLNQQFSSLPAFVTDLIAPGPSSGAQRKRKRYGIEPGAGRQGAHFLDQPTEKKFKCSFCDFRTNRKDYLASHNSMHADFKKYKCVFCDYETNWKTNHTNHLLMHSDIQKFKCSECSYGTNRKTDFTNHLAMHSDVKKFKCSECAFGTNWKSAFSNHVLTHSDTKKFECSQCSYATNRKYYLKLHSLTHSGIKKFKCGKCDYGTNRRADLANHVSLHESRKKFECAQCDYGTNWKTDFTKHLLIHTADQRIK